MTIGSMQEFTASQLGKVERRKQEEKQIKKGIYQMQMMIDCQNMETFNKESKKSRERTENASEKNREMESQSQERKKADVHTEMKRMMSATKQIQL